MAKPFNLTVAVNLQGPNNLQEIVSKIKKQIGSVKASLNLEIDNNSAKKIAEISSKLKELSSVAGAANTNLTALTGAIGKLGASFNQMSSISTDTSKNVNTISKSLSVAKKSVADTSTAIEEFGKQSGLAIKRFAAFSTVTGVIYALSSAVTSAYKEFITFDREIVRLSQVTGQSIKDLSGITQEITRLSTTLGVTSSDLLAVSTTLAQAGLSATETKVALEALAKSALAPSFENLAQTTEGAIATMRQFGIAANELDSALGSINAVAAKFAVEAGDIIAAIQRTGGVFASASRGVSQGTDALNEFIAIFTSVRATTRESAETIATGLRTIFTRIQRGKTIDELKKLGIELRDVEGKFVGPFEAVKRLSEGLNSIDPRSATFAKISEELGGFRQIGKVIPLIQQFATAQDALAVAQAGSSSLSKDAISAQASLAIQFEKTRQSFIALVRDIGNSTVFKGLITISLGLANGFITVAKTIQPILPLLLALGAIKIGGLASQFIGGFGKAFGGGAVGGGGGSPISPVGPSAGPTGDKGSATLAANTNALTALTSSINSLITRLGNTGSVAKFASGGLVPGNGGGDRIPALLEGGEVVMNRRSVQAYGAGNLLKMNSGGELAITDFDMTAAISKQRETPSLSGFKNPDLAVPDILGATPTGIISLLKGYGATGVLTARSGGPKGEMRAALGKFFSRNGIMVPSSRLITLGDQVGELSTAEKKARALYSLVKKYGSVDFFDDNAENVDAARMVRGVNARRVKVRQALGGPIQKFANGGQPLRETMTREDRILQGMTGGLTKRGKQIYNFGVAALRPGSGRKEDISFFGSSKAGQLSQTFSEQFDIPGDPPKKGQLYIGTLSDKGLDNEVESALKQGTAQAVFDAANILGSKIGTKPTSTTSVLNRIFKGSGFQSVIGSGLEAAIAMVSNSPYIDKTESTKSFDFPLGLGSAAKLFGIPSNIPTDATRTIGGFGKSKSKLKNSAISFVKAVEEGEFTRARRERVGSRAVGEMKQTGLLESLRPQIPIGFNSQASANKIKTQFGLSRSGLTSRGLAGSLETVAKAGKQKEFLEALKTAGIVTGQAEGGPQNNMVSAMVSNGEGYVDSLTAQQIGLQNLTAMNQADRNGRQFFSGGSPNGISMFKGPGTGTSDSIGPIDLPKGGFVLRKKAMDAMGFNQGGSVGIRRFQGGGEVETLRGLTTEELQIIIKNNTDQNKELDDTIAELIQAINDNTTSQEDKDAAKDLLKETQQKQQTLQTSSSQAGGVLESRGTRDFGRAMFLASGITASLSGKFNELINSTQLANNSFAQGVTGAVSGFITGFTVVQGTLQTFRELNIQVSGGLQKFIGVIGTAGNTVGSALTAFGSKAVESIQLLSDKVFQEFSTSKQDVQSATNPEEQKLAQDRLTESYNKLTSTVLSTNDNLDLADKLRNFGDSISSLTGAMLTLTSTTILLQQSQAAGAVSQTGQNIVAFFGQLKNIKVGSIISSISSVFNGLRTVGGIIRGFGLLIRGAGLAFKGLLGPLGLLFTAFQLGSIAYNFFSSSGKKSAEQLIRLSEATKEMVKSSREFSIANKQYREETLVQFERLRSSTPIGSPEKPLERTLGGLSPTSQATDFEKTFDINLLNLQFVRRLRSNLENSLNVNLSNTDLNPQTVASLPGGQKRFREIVAQTREQFQSELSSSETFKAAGGQAEFNKLLEEGKLKTDQFSRSVYTLGFTLIPSAKFIQEYNEKVLGTANAAQLASGSLAKTTFGVQKSIGNLSSILGLLSSRVKALSTDFKISSEELDISISRIGGEGRSFVNPRSQRNIDIIANPAGFSQSDLSDALNAAIGAIQPGVNNPEQQKFIESLRQSAVNAQVFSQNIPALLQEIRKRQETGDGSVTSNTVRDALETIGLKVPGATAEETREVQGKIADAIVQSIGEKALTPESLLQLSTDLDKIISTGSKESQQALQDILQLDLELQKALATNLDKATELTVKSQEFIRQISQRQAEFSLNLKETLGRETISLGDQLAPYTAELQTLVEQAGGRRGATSVADIISQRSILQSASQQFSTLSPAQQTEQSKDIVINNARLRNNTSALQLVANNAQAQTKALQEATKQQQRALLANKTLSELLYSAAADPEAAAEISRLNSVMSRLLEGGGDVFDLKDVGKVVDLASRTGAPPEFLARLEDAIRELNLRTIGAADATLEQRFRRSGMLSPRPEENPEVGAAIAAARLLFEESLAALTQLSKIPQTQANETISQNQRILNHFHENMRRILDDITGKQSDMAKLITPTKKEVEIQQQMVTLGSQRTASRSQIQQDIISNARLATSKLREDSTGFVIGPTGALPTSSTQISAEGLEFKKIADQLEAGSITQQAALAAMQKIIDESLRANPEGSPFAGPRNIPAQQLFGFGPTQRTVQGDLYSVAVKVKDASLLLQQNQARYEQGVQLEMERSQLEKNRKAEATGETFPTRLPSFVPQTTIPSPSSNWTQSISEAFSGAASNFARVLLGQQTEVVQNLARIFPALNPPVESFANSVNTLINGLKDLEARGGIKGPNIPDTINVQINFPDTLPVTITNETDLKKIASIVSDTVRAGAQEALVKLQLGKPVR